MFDTLCALPLTSELFSQTIHPSEPLIAVGLASGHVEAYRLPDEDSPSPEPDRLPSVSTSSLASRSKTDNPKYLSATSADLRQRNSSLRRSSTSSANGLSLISSIWRTRRHHGSCRTLSFSPDGDLLYSAGSDGLIKCARSETGRVEAKIAVMQLPNGNYDTPCLLKPLTHTAFLLATDGGNLHLYDTRIAQKGEGGARGVFGDGTESGKPVQTWRPHGDLVTSMTAVPAGESSTSGLPRMVVTTGDTTVSLVDVRKGVLGTSKEGKEVLMSSCVVDGRIYTGDSGGQMVGWDRTAVRGWEDGFGRQKVDVKRHILTPEGEMMEVDAPAEESVDAMCAMDGSVAGKDGAEMAVLGWDSGRIEVVSLGKKGRKGQVESSWMCDEADGVVAVGFEPNGRLVAGAGEVIKIYGYKGEAAIASDDEDEAEDVEDEEAMLVSAKDVDSAIPVNNDKRLHVDEVDENDDDDDDEQDDSSEEEKTKHKRKKAKKQKQGKGKKNQQTFSFAGLD